MCTVTVLTNSFLMAPERLMALEVAGLRVSGCNDHSVRLSPVSLCVRRADLDNPWGVFFNIRFFPGDQEHCGIRPLLKDTC